MNVFRKMMIVALTAGATALCSCSMSSGPNHYELTKKDSGRTLHLDKGDTFTVLLVSNPTTGYSWKFGNPPFDDKVMIVREDKFIPPENKELCGAPGKHSLTFLAKGSGRTDLQLIYVRPWEKNKPPAQEFNLTVIVKD